MILYLDVHIFNNFLWFLYMEWVPGIELGALGMPGMYSTTKLYPQPKTLLPTLSLYNHKYEILKYSIKITFHWFMSPHRKFIHRI